MEAPSKEYLESLGKFIAKGTAVIEGQNWTDTPLTAGEKSVIDMAIGWAAHQYAHGYPNVPRLPIDKNTFRSKAFKISLELIKDIGELDEDNMSSVKFRAYDAIGKLLNEATHFGHCCQGEYEDSCKYGGDKDCPVVEFRNNERKKKNVSEMFIERKNLCEIVTSKTLLQCERKFLQNRIVELSKEIEAILVPEEKSETGVITDKGKVQLYKNFIEEHDLKNEFDEWLNR